MTGRGAQRCAKMRACLAYTCLAGLILVAEAQIRIMAPSSLKNQYKSTHGRIDGSTATFGAPFFGERVLGRLVYGDSKQQQNHCSPNDYQVPKDETFKSGGFDEVRLINIIMVRRGNCSFVTKVKVASGKGAHAVIIIDKEESKMSAQDIRRIIVGDDGFGDTVQIPSLLIAWEDGKRLIDATKSTKDVIVELNWDVPTNHVVVVDLWMNSASRESQHFIKEFAPKRRALNEYLKFVPHYYIFSIRKATNGKDYNKFCLNEQAEYCAEDPDGSGPITGRDVVEEDLRQLCLHEHTKVKRLDLDNLEHLGVEYAGKYWDYVEEFSERCPLAPADPNDVDNRFGRVCSENLMKRVGVTETELKRIQNCAEVDGVEEKLKKQRDNHAWSPHALRINGWRYTGALDADLVTRAICAGFVSRPDECESLHEPVNPFKVHEDTSATGVHMTTFVLALLVVGVVTLGALLFYKRSLTKHIQSALREEVMLEVQSQMHTYRQMPGA